jgi:hypothetical protein
MSVPRRDRRGYGALALGFAAFAAATAGAAYWYLTRDDSSIPKIWNSTNPRIKKKSVVIVLNEVRMSVTTLAETEAYRKEIAII